MLYGVSANRMTLTRTRKRLRMARRGHTLMKHKLEELIRLFQEAMDRVLQTEDDVARRLAEVYTLFLLGQTRLRHASDAALRSVPLLKTRLAVTFEPVLNLQTPVFAATIDVERPPYGMLETTFDLDDSVRRFEATLPLLFRLAQEQRRIERLTSEIETTRRRVNALEYVLIPRLEEQARLIQMKLDEMDRANISRLMRIKSVIRNENEPHEGRAS